MYVHKYSDCGRVEIKENRRCDDEAIGIMQMMMTSNEFF